MVAVGMTLQPEQRYLELVAPLAAELADYVEVAPETLWRRDAAGELVPNAYHHAVGAFLGQTGKRCVAHGVGLSLGTADVNDAGRLQCWLERIRADHETFRFAWYTDHLGASVFDGQMLSLPLPLPLTAAAVEVVAERLAALQVIVPDVGFENSVFYFLLGAWLDEPEFITRILDVSRAHLLLDLHNVFTMATNLRLSADDYLDRLDLERVIEIHVSGGKDSDPAWLAGRTLRLDSHDAAVPEEVWSLLARTLRRCPNLRGVTLERVEGTVELEDVPVLRRELSRIHEALRARA